MTESAGMIMASIAAFAVIHSLTAGDALKSRLKQMMPKRLIDGWYRLAYNFLSVITLSPAIMVYLLSHDLPIITFSSPLSWAMRGVQILGLIGLVWSLVSIDLLRFLGIRQAITFLTNERLPLAAELLNTTGVYAYSRHPLYFFSLVVLWFAPQFTLSSLAMNTGFTLYFSMGSIIEERRLEAAYGDQYRQYQKRVPWLFPIPRVKR